MTTNTEMMPFFLVVANLLWFIGWEKSWYQKSSFVIAWSLLATVLSLTATPQFENDMVRYFIDGLHYLNNISPYEVSPAESPLFSRFSAVFSQVGFPNIRTVYPPLTLSFFAFLVDTSREDFGTFQNLLKALALFTGLLGSFLTTHLHFKGSFNDINFKKFLFLASHPFVVFEWYINLHFDFLIALVLIFSIFPKGRLSAIAVGLAASCKYLFFTLWLFHKPNLNIGSWALLGLGALAIPVFFLLTFPYDVFPLFENLSFFAKNWEMNSGAFRLFRHIGYGFYGVGEGGVSFALKLYGLTTLLTYIFVAMSKKTTLEKSFLFLFTWILLSPVCNPWYFSWCFFMLIHLSRPLRFLGFGSFVIWPLTYTFFLSRFQEKELFLYFFNFNHLLVWSLWIGALFFPKKIESFFSKNMPSDLI